MINNKSRWGNFSSSEIGNLMKVAKDGVSFGKPALDYIAECNFERKLGRSIETDTNAKNFSWGHLIERRCFNLLGLEYKLSSTETDVHPTIPYWVGSKDGNKFDEGKTVIEIKSPITLKSFCQFMEDPTIEGIRKNHPSGDMYFWQTTSNAILTESRWAELIIYVPFLSELPAIRELAADYDGDKNKVAWIHFAADNDLPWIPDHGTYKNLNVIRWEVQQSDIDALTERVLAAGALLEKRYESPQMMTLNEEGGK